VDVPPAAIRARHLNALWRAAAPLPACAPRDLPATPPLADAGRGGAPALPGSGDHPAPRRARDRHAGGGRALLGLLHPWIRAAGTGRAPARAWPAPGRRVADRMDAWLHRHAFLAEAEAILAGPAPLALRGRAPAPGLLARGVRERPARDRAARRGGGLGRHAAARAQRAEFRGRRDPGLAHRPRPRLLGRRDRPRPDCATGPCRAPAPRGPHPRRLSAGTRGRGRAGRHGAGGEPDRRHPACLDLRRPGALLDLQDPRLERGRGAAGPQPRGRRRPRQDRRRARDAPRLPASPGGGPRRGAASSTESIHAGGSAARDRRKDRNARSPSCSPTCAASACWPRTACPTTSSSS